ncbi:hypothetical protein JHK84_051838 [Glycine max]|nr:hypothetical protein JHK86_051795 [Glycine max]KAG5096250.1 hypothetical protein JHK84_051838 [Glycine max]
MNLTWKLMQELKPTLLMVLVQVSYAFSSVLYKLAINDGMSLRVLSAYRLIFGAAFSFSLALIFERCIHSPAKVSKEYPSHHSATALMALMGAIQATAFALCVEKDWSQWNLGSSIRLLTALFSIGYWLAANMMEIKESLQEKNEELERGRI